MVLDGRFQDQAVPSDGEYTEEETPADQQSFLGVIHYLAQRLVVLWDRHLKMFNLHWNHKLLIQFFLEVPCMFPQSQLMRREFWEIYASIYKLRKTKLSKFAHKSLEPIEVNHY